MEKNKDMADRFAAIRKKMGATQADFAEVLGISRGMISVLEIGAANLTKRTIKAVCKAYNISENWLKTGQGEMFNPPSEESELQNEEEKELIRLFRRLTSETKRMVVEIVRKFANSGKEDNLPIRNGYNLNDSVDNEEMARKRA